jgi:hypothetical protein
MTDIQNPAVEPVETPAEEVKTTTAPIQSKEEVLARLDKILETGEEVARQDLDILKNAFYRLQKQETDEAYKAYIAEGGNPDEYVPAPLDDEAQFKAKMNLIKERRAKAAEELERQKEENYNKKLEIIEIIKTMLATPDEVNKNYNDFKQLQEQWNEIKLVPADKATDLWKTYQMYVEQFYDNLKINNELRAYDFKKNLELKTRLCEAAEKLAEEPDAISAFHQLQKLHQEYRETGPVAKELREEIWQRFKAASSVINKHFQQHFDGIRAKEEENLARKTELCEKVEAIVAQENKTSSDWERRTKEILELQNEWKTIGFAPQKMNVKIFERFRASCDDFFARKAQYFRDLKEIFRQNADKKRALIEKAKALQDSTEWKSTSDKLINLQKEWKTIGMVPKRLGDQLWDEFLGACNKFCEARNAAGAGTRSEERDNLEKKRYVIARLKAIA